MNTQKRVNERLQKIALKNQKIDLSLVSDLSSALGEANRWASEIKSMGTSADKYINEFKESLQKKKDVIGSVIMYQDRGGKVLKGLEIVINKFEQATKDLGVKPNSVDEYKIALKVLDELKTAIRKMESSEKELKQIN